MANTIASKKQASGPSVAFRREAVKRLRILTKDTPSMGFQTKNGLIVLSAKERFL